MKLMVLFPNIILCIYLHGTSIKLMSFCNNYIFGYLQFYRAHCECQFSIMLLWLMVLCVLAAKKLNCGSLCHVCDPVCLCACM